MSVAGMSTNANSGQVKQQTQKPSLTPPSNSEANPLIGIQPQQPTYQRTKNPQKDKKPVRNYEAELKPPKDPTGCYQHLPPPLSYGGHLEYWTVDEGATTFWNQYGRKVAIKNLIISIGNLTLEFSVWMIWSVVSVLLLEAWEATCMDDTNDLCYYPFNEISDTIHDHPDEYTSTLWLLIATAGLSGATLRTTNSFMIGPSGGRVVISQTGIIAIVAMVLMATALNNTNVSFYYLIVIALITGVGGGAFASSMSNISFFFPKKTEGLPLGLNAGMGNLGVSLLQMIVPGIVSYAAFGKLSIEIDGVYIANAAIFWIPFLVVMLILCWLFMNSLPQHKGAANTPVALSSYYYLEFVGYLGAISAVAVLLATRDYMTIPGLDIVLSFALWFMAVIITVGCMKWIMCWKFLEGAHHNIEKTMVILKMKDTWLIVVLYVMTFGSFIGFSNSFPMLIKEFFPNKDPLDYAWLGPLVGSCIRPIGGWLSDRYGGAKVTHWDIHVMIVATVGVGITVLNSKDNEDIFPLFFALFLLLFITTGVGNGSVFRMIPLIFPNKEHAGPVLGWSSAIAAYGAFIFPMIFKATIAWKVPEWAFFGLTFYYFICLLVNWFFYYKECWGRPCKQKGEDFEQP
eukprot:17185_1